MVEDENNLTEVADRLRPGDSIGAGEPGISSSLVAGAPSAAVAQTTVGASSPYHSLSGQGAPVMGGPGGVSGPSSKVAAVHVQKGTPTPPPVIDGDPCDPCPACADGSCRCPIDPVTVGADRTKPPPPPEPEPPKKDGEDAGPEGGDREPPSLGRLQAVVHSVIRSIAPTGTFPAGSSGTTWQSGLTTGLGSGTGPGALGVTGPAPGPAQAGSDVDWQALEDRLVASLEGVPAAPRGGLPLTEGMGIGDPSRPPSLTQEAEPLTAAAPVRSGEGPEEARGTGNPMFPIYGAGGAPVALQDSLRIPSSGSARIDLQSVLTAALPLREGGRGSGPGDRPRIGVQLPDAIMDAVFAEEIRRNASEEGPFGSPGVIGGPGPDLKVGAQELTLSMATPGFQFGAIDRGPHIHTPVPASPPDVSVTGPSLESQFKKAEGQLGAFIPYKPPSTPEEFARNEGQFAEAKGKYEAAAADWEDSAKKNRTSAAKAEAYSKSLTETAKKLRANADAIRKNNPTLADQWDKEASSLFILAAEYEDFAKYLISLAEAQEKEAAYFWSQARVMAQSVLELILRYPFTGVES